MRSPGTTSDGRSGPGCSRSSATSPAIAAAPPSGRPRWSIAPRHSRRWTTTASAEESALQRIGAGPLAAAVGTLRPDEQELLTYRFVLDLSEEETAAALGVRRGTVKSRTSRALARLRSVLPEEPA